MFTRTQAVTKKIVNPFNVIKRITLDVFDSHLLAGITAYFCEYQHKRPKASAKGLGKLSIIID